jgi:hypothetical protein
MVTSSAEAPVTYPAIWVRRAARIAAVTDDALPAPLTRKLPVTVRAVGAPEVLEVGAFVGVVLPLVVAGGVHAWSFVSPPAAAHGAPPPDWYDVTAYVDVCVDVAAAQAPQAPQLPTQFEVGTQAISLIRPSPFSQAVPPPSAAHDTLYVAVDLPAAVHAVHAVHAPTQLRRGVQLCDPRAPSLAAQALPPPLW